MRICIVSPSLYPPVIGGVEVGVSQLAAHLAVDNEIHVLTKQVEGCSEYELINGVHVYRVFPNIKFYTVSFFLVSYPICVKWLRRINPDVCNIHYIIPYGFGAVLACKRLRIKSVLTMEGWDVYDPLVTPKAVYHPFIRYCIKNANVLTANSSFTAGKIKELWYNRKAIVIPYGVDVEFFKSNYTFKSKIRKEFSLSKEVIFLCVQRLHPRKKVDVTIKAFREMIASGCNTVLFIVGKGPEENSLKSLVSELKLKSRVIFTGSVSNSKLRELYSAADVFVLHSLYEGLGIVIIEALSSGLPVIATNSGGTIDLVDESVGFLIQPGNVEELSSRMVALYKDSSLREKLGVAARRFAVNNLSWEKIVKKYVKALKS